MRLTHELNKLKENTQKNNLNTVEQVVGWSPTSNTSPEPELPPEIKLDSDTPNDESVEVADTVASNEAKR